VTTLAVFYLGAGFAGQDACHKIMKHFFPYADSALTPIRRVGCFPLSGTEGPLGRPRWKLTLAAAKLHKGNKGQNSQKRKHL
jgi:hypothetical protein